MVIMILSPAIHINFMYIKGIDSHKIYFTLYFPKLHMFIHKYIANNSRISGDYVALY